jgi:hypothetical protein
VGAWLTKRALTKRALTKRALRATALVGAGMVLLGGTLVGCGSTPAAARPPGALAATSPVPGSPAPSMITGSFPPSAQQPSGSCPFVSQRQVAAALGQSVQHVQGCAYSFARGAGTAAVITSRYNSVVMARGCLHNQASGHGFRVARIPGLGPESESVIMPRQSTTAAVLVRGDKMLAVVIFWRRAAGHPEIAVTLLREATANLGRYTTGIQPVC